MQPTRAAVSTPRPSSSSSKSRGRIEDEDEEEDDIRAGRGVYAVSFHFHLDSRRRSPNARGVDTDDSDSIPTAEVADVSSDASASPGNVSAQPDPGDGQTSALAGSQLETQDWQGGQEGEDWSAGQGDASPPPSLGQTGGLSQTGGLGQTGGKIRGEDLAQNGIDFYTALNDGGAITPNSGPAPGDYDSSAGFGGNDSGFGAGPSLLGSYDPSIVMGYDLTQPIGFPGSGIDGLPATSPGRTGGLGQTGGTGGGLPFENSVPPWQFSFDGPPPKIPVDDPNATNPDIPEVHVTLDPEGQVTRGTQPGTSPEIPGVTGGTLPPGLSDQPPGGPFAGAPGDLVQSYDPSKVMGYDLTKPIGFPGTGIDGLQGDPPFTLQQEAPPVVRPSLDNDNHLPFAMRQDWPTPLDGGFPQFRPPTGKVVKYETDNVAIQVEGSPFAYDPRDPWAQHGALDYLQNAQDDHGRWVGVATDKHGQPFTNGFGNYVSQTGWQRPGTDGSHQNDYVNGDYVPTVSLTATQAQGMKKGDAVWLVNETTGQSTLAVYADDRHHKDGIEISTAAAINLGVPYGKDSVPNPGPHVGPTTPTRNDHIVMYTLPGSRVPGWFPGK